MLQRLVDVRERERPGLWWSFAYFFALLCGYSVLKPIRDEMGVAGELKALQWVFTATFAGTLIAVPVFSGLVAKIPRRRLLPWVYRFLWLTLIGFFVLIALGISKVAVARAFFVWVSVINIFLTAVFWAFMADLFRAEQGKRLFGFIAAGGTAGALVGPLLCGALVELAGAHAVLIVAAVLFEAAAQCIGPLVRWADANLAAEDVERKEEPVGGGAFTGMRRVVASPFLLALCGQTLLYAITSTVLYTQYLALVSSTVTDGGHRTQLFALIETSTQGLTLLLQGLVTGRVVQRLGLAVALGVVPVLTTLGFLGLGVAAAMALAIGLFATRRALHYAFERPAREVLFTTVDREAKYKSKTFIDTVIYRGGDAVGGWYQSGLGVAGLSGSGAAFATAPLAAAWLAVNLYLARKQSSRRDA